MAITRKQVIERAIDDINRKATPRQREVGELYFRALEGDGKAAERLAEGISTSDVPALLEPATNVTFLAQFADVPIVWDQIAERYDAEALGTIEWGGFDFDTDALKQGVNDGDQFVGAGLPGVAEYGEYPAVKFTTETLEAELRKDGLRFRISWEAMMKSRRFDWIGRSTAFFARSAAEQEDVALAKQFVSTAGTPNSAFTTLASNPALTLPNLEAGLATARQIKVNGRPVNAQNYALVTGTALSQTARNLLSITQVERTQGSDVFTIAPATGGIRAVEFAMLDTVGGFATPGAVDDYWFLVPQGTVRPAFLELFLEGYRTPSISIKDSGHFYLGGGLVPQREGSFEEDDVQTRVRHVVDAHALTPAIVVDSNGSGS